VLRGHMAVKVLNLNLNSKKKTYPLGGAVGAIVAGVIVKIVMVLANGWTNE